MLLYALTSADAPFTQFLMWSILCIYTENTKSARGVHNIEVPIFGQYKGEPYGGADGKQHKGVTKVEFFTPSYFDLLICVVVK